MTSTAHGLALLSFIATVGCAGAPAEAPPAPADASHEAHADHDAHAAPPADAAHDAHADHGAHAGAGDLKSIMVDLGARMDDVSHGLWLDDHAAVAAAAHAIADHPHVAPAEMKRIQGALGPGFGDFVAADKAVHNAAVQLHKAAGTGDSAAVLTAVAAVQQGCVACHTQFREPLRQ